jgi:hypothetical protein
MDRETPFACLGRTAAISGYRGSAGVHRAEPILQVEGFCDLAVLDGLNTDGRNFPEKLIVVSATEHASG